MCARRESLSYKLFLDIKWNILVYILYDTIFTVKTLKIIIIQLFKIFYILIKNWEYGKNFINVLKYNFFLEYLQLLIIFSAEKCDCEKYIYFRNICTQQSRGEPEE